MLSADCMCCLVKRQLAMIKNETDEEKKASYMKEALEFIAGAAPGESAPVVVRRLDASYREHFGDIDGFEDKKKKYNLLILEKEEEIERTVTGSEDRLLCALKLARVGNYIDFGALKDVSDDTLGDLIKNAPDDEIDMDEYSAFKRELTAAKTFVYLTDNCGEIVFDKILIKTVREAFPDLDLKVVVRGRPVLNDATAEDAAFVGIDRIAPVIPNGSGIAGTYLKDISPDVRRLIESADLVLAKGQGNFETLYGCGLNVYYAFLCKCIWFEKRFGMERLKGVFVNERRKRFDVGGSFI